MTQGITFQTKVAALQTAPIATAAKPGRTEWIWLFASLAALFALDLATCNYYPSVWCDDVTWSEPAINLATTGKFTTSIWQFQPAGTFWAVNPPLYPLLLAGWIKIAGTSLLAVRSFNFLLVKLAIVLVWIISRKGGFTRTALQRFALLALIHFGYGMSFAYRCSRPDILGLICVLLIALSFLIQTPIRRQVTLCALAGFSMWIGLQVALYLWLLCMAGWIIFKKVTMREMVFISVGMSGGLFLLAIFYSWHDALQYLVSSVLHVSSEHTHRSGVSSFLGSLPRRFHNTFQDYFSDFSLLPLMAGVAFLCLSRGHILSAQARKMVLFAVLVFVGIPLAFNLVAHFAFYYSYMLYIPAALALCYVHAEVTASNGESRSRARIGLIFVLLVALAVMIGMPLRLSITALFSRITPRSEYSGILESTICPDDVVFCEYQAFFETKQVTRKVYTSMYSGDLINLSNKARRFTAEEKKNINVMVIQPRDRDALTQYFGGAWEAKSQPFGDSLSSEDFASLPFLGKKLQHHFENPQMIRFQLQVFRRK